MNGISKFADRRPLILALSILMTWLVIAGAINGATILLSEIPVTALIQAAGTLSATGVLLLITLRLGWLREIGVTRFGTLSTWLLTLGIATHVVLAGFYAFFGEVSFSVGSLVGASDARAILLHSLIAGLVEEMVFRGILLYVLVRAWGEKRRGRISAVVVQAALFGALHALQAFAGSAPRVAIANVLATFIFGLWTGALVLFTRTVWPAVVLHLMSNAFILVKGLSSRWVDPVYVGYLLEALLEVPLVGLGLWYMLSIHPKTAGEEHIDDRDKGLP